jgi:glycosyltransferase involved in cell wall biosynthesis
MNTLIDKLNEHNNDYGIDVNVILAQKEPHKLPSLSVIIPYYKTGEIINHTLHHLYNSLRLVGTIEPGWDFEVLVIDDGSKERTATESIHASYENLRIITLDENVGRSRARNRGLECAQKELCLFMDSDILIDTLLVYNHLKVHCFIRENKNNLPITFSFFEFSDSKSPLLTYDVITPADLKLNDFRLHCVYGETWYGCEEDKQFIGQQMRIMLETDWCRKWKGKYKVWVLPNIILGGFFMVDRLASNKVGGFSNAFSGYGFTEITLSTKLIAHQNSFAIPVPVGGGGHIEDADVNLTRTEKDVRFREKHNLFYNIYLHQTIENAIKDQIV